jgi:hypothetical protein
MDPATTTQLVTAAVLLAAFTLLGAGSAVISGDQRGERPCPR